MFVKPMSPLVRVPDPAQQGTPDYWLPPGGREVEPSMYWTRRILDGDVEEVEPRAAPAVAPMDSTPPAAAA